MGTPERNNQIPPSVSKFEESPVFNFLNSLSPIKPVKSIHISQSFNSLSFATLPSIFTSPHVSSGKESKFLKRHQFSDASQPEFSCEDGKKVSTNEGMDAAHDSAAQKANYDPGRAPGGFSVEPSDECLKLAAVISQTLSYDCRSPDCNRTTSCNAETKFMSRLMGASGPVVPFIQEVSERGLFGSEVHTELINQSDQIKEPAESEWENLISDAADSLIFESPNDSEAFKHSSQKSEDPVGELSSNSLHNLQTTLAVSAVGSFEQNKSEVIETGEVSNVKSIAETQGAVAGSSLNDCMAADSTEKFDDERVWWKGEGKLGRIG